MSTHSLSSPVDRIDRYTIIKPEPVGEGGFGKVREAKDEVLERKVAVKVLDRAWASIEEEERERFRREARILAKLAHPNIPAIYDVVYDDERFEIVFQFVEGKNLRTILDDEERIKLSETRVWFDQIASALQHAHEHGIVHRDVKPENIIISPDRKHCWLVDFGIALSQDEIKRLTDSDEFIGTLGYMSPEQQNGGDVDGSDDIYVLGVCLYEALCGRQMPHGSYQPLNSINELIPTPIDDLVQRCIAAKPLRLQKASEFRLHLQTALHKYRALSEILSAGQLHEVAGAIREMTPTQFMELRAGQRLLILSKCQDLVSSTNRNLAVAREEFLESLSHLGILLPPTEYTKIIVPAIDWGFGGHDDGFGQKARGVRGIRDSVVLACSKVAVPNHRVIVDALLNWLDSVRLDEQRAAFCHSVRLAVTALMANPECDDDDAERLSTSLNGLNERQRKLQDSSSDSDAGSLMG